MRTSETAARPAFDFTPARREEVRAWATLIGIKRAELEDGRVQLSGPDFGTPPGTPLTTSSDTADLRMLCELLGVCAEQQCAIERCPQPLEYPWCYPKTFMRAITARTQPTVA